jgi:sorbitol-specific phosphotransferase system component IIC
MPHTTPGRIFVIVAVLAALVLLGVAVVPAALVQVLVRVGLLGAGIATVLALRPRRALH